MILIALFALAWFVVLPTGATITAIAAGSLAIAGSAVAIAAGGPGAGLTAWLTGSRHGLVRGAGWVGLAASTTIGVAAAASASISWAALLAASAVRPLVGF